jgi:hypothetical protein
VSLAVRITVIDHNILSLIAHVNVCCDKAVDCVIKKFVVFYKGVVLVGVLCVVMK